MATKTQGTIFSMTNLSFESSILHCNLSLARRLSHHFGGSYYYILHTFAFQRCPLYLWAIRKFIHFSRSASGALASLFYCGIQVSRGRLLLDSVSLAPKQETRYHPSPHWPWFLDWSVGAFFLLASCLHRNMVSSNFSENRGFSTMGLPCMQCKKSFAGFRKRQRSFKSTV
jgi:hypothetical protein